MEEKLLAIIQSITPPFRELMVFKKLFMVPQKL
jgi:hypothetical protein